VLELEWGGGGARASLFNSKRKSLPGVIIMKRRVLDRCFDYYLLGEIER